jgi:hypothetical protein
VPLRESTAQTVLDTVEIPGFEIDYPDTPEGRAAKLIEDGVGRRRLARELDISEHAARQLLAQRGSP